MARECEFDRLKTFDPTGDATSVSPRWKRWKRSFEYYLIGKGITVDARKTALLLHVAGEKVQDIFEGLPQPVVVEGESEYDKTMRMLDIYFVPQANVPYERHVFRQMQQEKWETIDQFVSRLRVQAKNCDFGGNVDENIRDQVIDKCVQARLRMKLLARGDLTLKDVQDTARAMETAELQSKKMETDFKTESLNAVGTSKPKPSEKKFKPKCYRCGREGHISRDTCCPAKNATCRKCKKVGHFVKVCKTKSPSEYQPRDRRRNKSGSKVNEIEERVDDYAFGVSNAKDERCCYVSAIVGGVTVDMLIDSGATCNIIDKKTWEYMKKKNVKCVSRKTERSLYAYGSMTTLDTLGEFKCQICVNGIEADADFVVYDGDGKPVLGCKTSQDLGVLKFNVNSITVDDVTQQFPECFEGVGKLTNYQAKIHVDPDVKPVAQNYRRLAFSLREKVETKLEELVAMDIIEEVQGPTPWVSPIVVVPKPDNDIRLCVDMRQANNCIIRERYPIPTIDEVLENLNESTVFTKLDLKWGFHQIELEPESRKITTFVTHRGLFQYKRLMFGISSAPEMYQHIIQQVLTGCEALNIADDIVVHGRDREDHDNKLLKTLERLRERGLTLNKEKCQFAMSKLTFMGYLLTEKGIGPTAARVEAVKQFRAPSNVAEVRSFLGLVNFSARFIPNLATKADPLRKLTRKVVPFKWESKQQEAFDKLKSDLENSETLSYFDKNAKIKVVTDASPVGLGAVLVQEKDGVEKPVCYASKSLTQTERRYSQTEKEALAIVWACERFHVYLYGVDFELQTDHKPLEYIYSKTSKPSARVERWVLRLQPYSFTVKYIPGPTNIADALSRLVKGQEVIVDDDAQAYVHFVAVNAVPHAISVQEIEEASSIDEEFIELRRCIMSDKWDICPTPYKAVRLELCVYGQLILRGTRLVIPKKLRKRIVELGHEGHQGVVKTKQRLRTKVWWPGIDKDVESKCKTCHGCQLVSLPNPPEPLKTTKLPTEPWQDVAADQLGPLPTGEYLLVIVDYFTRFYEVVILKSITADSIIKAMEPVFARYGYPVTIRTDNGPQFVSETFEQYLKQNGMVHRRSTPYWPQANGEVERQNRSLLKALKVAHSEGRNWRREMYTFLLAYRTTAHSTTGASPAELMFGRKIRTKIPEFGNEDQRERFTEVRDRGTESKQKTKDYSDARRHAKQSNIQVGDKVLLEQVKQNKLSTNYQPSPYQVTSRDGNQVTIKSAEGVEYKRNVSHMKHLQEDEIVSPQLDEIEIQFDEEEIQEPADKLEEKEEKEETASRRPTRLRRLPTHLKDYELYYVKLNN